MVVKYGNVPMATQAIEKLEAVQLFALFGSAVIMALAHTFIPQLE